MTSEREKIKQEMVRIYHCSDPHAESCDEDCTECKKTLKTALDALEQIAFSEGYSRAIDECNIKSPCKVGD